MTKFFLDFFNTLSYNRAYIFILECTSVARWNPSSTFIRPIVYLSLTWHVMYIKSYLQQCKITPLAEQYCHFCRSHFQQSDDPHTQNPTYFKENPVKIPTKLEKQNLILNSSTNLLSFSPGNGHTATVVTPS